MGFNPHRQYKARGATDIVIVVAATAIVIALVAWALVG
jgi:hypothetical protein